MITNIDEIANELNTYFVNIGRSLNDQIQVVTTGNHKLRQEYFTCYDIIRLKDTRCKIQDTKLYLNSVW